MGLYVKEISKLAGLLSRVDRGSPFLYGPLLPNRNWSVNHISHTKQNMHTSLLNGDVMFFISILFYSFIFFFFNPSQNPGSFDVGSNIIVGELSLDHNIFYNVIFKLEEKRKILNFKINFYIRLGNFLDKYYSFSNYIYWKVNMHWKILYILNNIYWQWRLITGIFPLSFKINCYIRICYIFLINIIHLL